MRRKLLLAMALVAIATAGCGSTKPPMYGEQDDDTAQAWRQANEDAKQWEAEREAREWREAWARFGYCDSCKGWIAWRDSVMESDFLKGVHQ